MKEIPEELLPVIDYWERHGKATVAVATAAIVVGVGCWAWNNARAKTRCEVTDALVSNFTDETGVQLATPVEEIDAAIGKSVDPAAIPLLKLRLAKMQYVAGDYVGAEKSYAELNGKGAAPAGFEDAPAYGLAATLEAENKFAEAQKAYADAIKAFPDSPMRLEAEMGAARCLAREGKKDLAVEMLQARLTKLEDLAATKMAREDALAQAEATTAAVRADTKLGDKQKLDALKKSDADTAAIKKELAALETSLQTKDLAMARVRATLDLVKRWENRAEGSLVDAVGQVSETLQQAEDTSATPAEKKAE